MILARPVCNVLYRLADKAEDIRVSPEILALCPAAENAEVFHALPFLLTEILLRWLALGIVATVQKATNVATHLP